MADKKDKMAMPHFMQRQYGKSASLLSPSSEEMSDVRKKMVRYALDFPIRDIRTYAGYKGDLLVEITSNNIDLLLLLQVYAESLGMETVIKEQYETFIHELYCITPDENAYRIKKP